MHRLIWCLLCLSDHNSEDNRATSRRCGGPKRPEQAKVICVSIVSANNDALYDHHAQVFGSFHIVSGLFHW